jgi:integrase
MIDRGNWKRTKEYLEYRLHVDQISEGSLKLEKTYLRYLLEWAQETPFRKAPRIRPTLQEFLLSFRLDGSKERLSIVSIKKILSTARRFFTWFSDFKHGGLKQTWIQTLKYRSAEPQKKNREAIPFLDILEIAKAPVRNNSERRTRAAACFWYLTGIRLGAFVSLRLNTVDVRKGEVLQFPELGVRTKNNKHAKTYFLPIPELLEVVEDWDSYIRSILPPDGFWFAPFMPGSFEVDPENLEYVKTRRSGARKDLRAWLKRVELPYHSPHSFRHGHIQWGYLHAEKPAQRKAVSENVMHNSEQITDAVYSNFQESELKNQIASLGGNGGKDIGLSEGELDKIAQLVTEKLLEKMK